MTQETKNQNALTEPSDLVATDPSRLIDTANPAVKIRYWYDRSIRLWTCYLEETETGFQIDGAEYAPRKSELPTTLAMLQRAATEVETEEEHTARLAERYGI